MRRERNAYAVLLLALSGFGFLAWLSRQPDAPFFERAERWPVAGPAVARVRRAFLPTGRAPATSDLRADPLSRRELIYIGIGAVLRERPLAEATPVEKTRRLWSYEIVSSQGRWLQVRRVDGSSAWYDPQAPRDRTPPLGNAPQPVRPLASRPASQQRLTAVRAEMGPRIWQGEVAGYDLLTDVPPGPWQEALASRVEVVESVYEEHYGVAPVGLPSETVVVFAEESSYRRFERQIEGLTAAQSTGHAGSGMVVLYRGERPLEDLASTVIHEIGHLLNRRALGPALPPWLDEGLAEELAHLAVPARLATDGDPYRGLRVESETKVEYSGVLAALAVLRQALASGELLSLASLTGLDAAAFSGSERSARLYDQSALWLHSLLEDPLPRPYGPGFRDYLRSIAEGEPATAAALLTRLGADWGELELAFRSFLIDEAARVGVGSSGHRRLRPQGALHLEEVVRVTKPFLTERAACCACEAPLGGWGGEHW